MPLTTLDATPALVVIDLQKGITSRPTAPLPVDIAVQHSSDLAEAFRAHGLPVVLVNVTGGAPGRTDAGCSAASRGGAGSATGPAADYAELVDELGAQPEDQLVTKQTWGAFTGTSLQSSLDGAGVTQVVLTGVATSIGVESTARFAHELGYHVVLVTDAMTDLSEVAHEHSVGVTFPRLGETTDTAEVLRRLGERTP